jgi:hypothetical protein
MDLNEFRKLFNEYFDDFVADWNTQNKSDPKFYPMSLPSFADWEEQFMFFLESNLTLGDYKNDKNSD